MLSPFCLVSSSISFDILQFILKQVVYVPSTLISLDHDFIMVSPTCSWRSIFEMTNKKNSVKNSSKMSEVVLLFGP